nr:MAG TPA: ParB protein [Caudoviricetes sp.]
MKIEKVALTKIKMYENNAKKHPQEQVEQIKKSIQEFGNNDPIAIDENNVIIEGHGRYLALKQLGYKTAECIRINDLTDEQKRAYILVHNKLTMNTGFDADKLAQELDKIKSIDMKAYDFEVYDSKEVEDLKVGEEKEKTNTIVLTLNEEQYQEIMRASDIIENSRKELHNFGNPNKRSNLINEVIYEWGKERGLL